MRAAGLNIRTVAGGLLVQSRDNATVDDLELKVVTKREPPRRNSPICAFAFRVAST